MIDVLSCILVLVCILAGYLRGILRGALSLLALLAAYFASATAAAPFARALTRLLKLPPGAAYAPGRVLAGLAIYLSLLVSVHLLDKKVGRSREGTPRPWNRNLGALAGLVFGLVLVFWVMCLGDALVKAFPERKGRLAASVRRSTLRRLVKNVNPADRFLVTDSLRLLNAAREDEEVLEKLTDKEPVKRLLDHPKVQAVLENEELMAALQAGRIAELVKNQEIRDLLRDRQVRELFFSEELRASVREATK